MDQYWAVEVWRIPPGPERYRDAHQRCRDRVAKMDERTREVYGLVGSHPPVFCGTVESVGRVDSLCRKYKTERRAEAYAARMREQWPVLYVEIVRVYVLGFGF